MSDTRTARAATADTVGLGIALMLLGDFMFAANDVMGKWLVATYPVGQVLFLRSLAALIVLAPMAWRIGWRDLVRVERPGVQALRVAMSIAEILCFYAAAIYLPIADIMTFYLAGPIYVAALSPWLLGERVGWKSWIAVVAGFGGVVVALRPSAETLTAPALISILGSFAFALMVVQSRQLRRTPDVTLVFWQTAGAFVAGLVLVPFQWVQPNALDFGALALLGVVSMVAHVLINRSLKLAPAAVVAPFQYTLLLWALVFGWLVFGDVPKSHMLVGAAIIVGAGLFLFERKPAGRKGEPADVQDIV